MKKPFTSAIREGELQLSSLRMDHKGGNPAGVAEGGANKGGKPSGVAEGGARGGSTGGYSSKGQGEASSSAKPIGSGDGAMKAPGAEGYILREAFERNPQGYFQGLHHGDKGGK
ncbi:keratin, type II cytoskeletal 2 epidermal-like [Zingiber officinale]|uniref:Uncharacterized protein n=1 Tax=Zingiber officinale TaxID=94328 RepID=A0A8J5LSL3_ZINOF|nr:keratin, type II cytoskeletal 2 epidermal-like [Zingiber officinale]KAG6536924.1 hypothetical protein ZIOFF_002002 [Zingiber officinale]